MNNEDKILQMLEQMNNKFDNLEADMKEMKTEIKELKIDYKQMQFDIKKIDSRLDNLETDVKYIKTGIDEHGKFLGAITHRQEVHKAEIDKLNIETAKISGSIKSIETKIDSLSEDLYSTQQITGKNYSDISKLKASFLK